MTHLWKQRHVPQPEILSVAMIVQVKCFIFRSIWIRMILKSYWWKNYHNFHLNVKSKNFYIIKNISLLLESSAWKYHLSKSAINTVKQESYVTNISSGVCSLNSFSDIERNLCGTCAVQNRRRGSWPNSLDDKLCKGLDYVLFFFIFPPVYYYTVLYGKSLIFVLLLGESRKVRPKRKLQRTGSGVSLNSNNKLHHIFIVWSRPQLLICQMGQ